MRMAKAKMVTLRLKASKASLRSKGIKATYCLIETIVIFDLRRRLPLGEISLRREVCWKRVQEVSLEGHNRPAGMGLNT